MSNFFQHFVKIQILSSIVIEMNDIKAEISSRQSLSLIFPLDLNRRFFNVSNFNDSPVLSQLSFMNHLKALNCGY